jgi:hypothetical protein
MMRMFGLSLAGLLLCLSIARPGFAQKAGNDTITADQIDIGKVQPRIQKYDQALGVVTQLARSHGENVECNAVCYYPTSSKPIVWRCGPDKNVTCSARSARRLAAAIEQSRYPSGSEASYHLPGRCLAATRRRVEAIAELGGIRGHPQRIPVWPGIGDVQKRAVPRHRGVDCQNPFGEGRQNAVLDPLPDKSALVAVPPLEHQRPCLQFENGDAGKRHVQRGSAVGPWC